MPALGIDANDPWAMGGDDWMAPIGDGSYDPGDPPPTFPPPGGDPGTGAPPPITWPAPGVVTSEPVTMGVVYGDQGGGQPSAAARAAAAGPQFNTQGQGQGDGGDTGAGGTGGAGTTNTGGGDTISLHDAVANLYKQFLGRDASEDEINGWIAGKQPDQLGAIQQQIFNSQEAQAYRKAHPNGAASTGSSASGLPSLNGRVTDPNVIKQYISNWATQDKADPSLGKDPDYWVKRIVDTGGLGNDNLQYWQNASYGPTAFYLNPGRESGGGGGYGNTGSMSNLASYMTNSPLLAPWTQQFSFDQFKGPTYTPIDQFKAPTALDEQNDPGYQARLRLATDSIQRSAAARGSLLTGGTLRDLDQYSQDYASNEYQNVYGRAANTWQMHNAQNVQDFQTLYNSDLSTWTTNYNKALTEYQQAYNIYEQNQAKQYNRIANLAGLGQTAAGALGSAGLQTAGLVGNTNMGMASLLGGLYTGIGNANAASSIAGGNIWGGLFGGLGNFASMYPFLNMGKSPGGGAPPNSSSYPGGNSPGYG